MSVVVEGGSASDTLGLRKKECCKTSGYPDSLAKIPVTSVLTLKLFVNSVDRRPIKTSRNEGGGPFPSSGARTGASSHG